MQESTRIALTEAGLMAGLGYWSIRNKVMRRELKGGKDSQGWWVDPADLDRFIREQRKAGKQAA